MISWGCYSHPKRYFRGNKINNERQKGRKKEKEIYNQKEREKERGTTVSAKQEGRKEGRKSSIKLRAFLHNDFITHAKENQIAYEE